MYGISSYLDAGDKIIETNIVQISSFSQNVQSLAYTYKTFQGRIVGFFLIPLLSIWGKPIVSVLAGFVVSSCVTATLTITFSSIKQALRHPLIILYLYLTLFFCAPYPAYNFMWTMLTIYSLTVTLFLLYLLILLKMEAKGNSQDVRTLILFNLFGLLCGVAHEALGAVLALMLLVKCISYIFMQKRVNLTYYIKLHIGFVVGYCITFFSPGNFIRLQSTHSGYNNSIIDRMLHVVTYSSYSLLPDFINQRVKGIILGICFILFWICIIRIERTRGIRAYISEHLYLITGVIGFLVVFSIVPYMGTYCTGFFVVLVCILFIKTFTYARFDLFIYFKHRATISIICCSVSIMLLVLNNFNWFSAFIGTSQEWSNRINEAKKNNQSVVYVPLLPDKQILFPGYTNNPVNFSDEYNIAFFGIQIIPE